MDINLSRFAYRRQANSLQGAAEDNCNAERQCVPNRATSISSCSLFSGFAASKRQKRSCIEGNKDSKEEAKENFIADEESPKFMVKTRTGGHRICARSIASDSDEERSEANPRTRISSGMSVKRVRFSPSLLEDDIPGRCGCYKCGCIGGLWGCQYEFMSCC